MDTFRFLRAAAALLCALALALVGCEVDGEGAVDGNGAGNGDGNGAGNDEGIGEGDAEADDVPTTAPTVGPPAPEASPTDEADAAEREMERLVLDLVNDERRARDLEPLEWDERLADLARDWSRMMAEEGRLDHQELDVMLERSDGFTAVGENIFHTTGSVPASTIHVGWMQSEQHRRNVLLPHFDRLGVGFVCTEGGQTWATQRFGRTADAGPPPLGDDMGGDVPPEEPIVATEGQGPACPGGIG